MKTGINRWFLASLVHKPKKMIKDPQIFFGMMGVWPSWPGQDENFFLAKTAPFHDDVIIRRK
jgi:hypothetical protein